MKRFISMMLAFVMVLGMLPVGEMVVFAADDDPAVIGSILVTKVYSKPNVVDAVSIEVTGTNLHNLGQNPVVAFDGQEKILVLKTINENKRNLDYRIENPSGVYRIRIDGTSYLIGSGVMPSVSSLDPSNGLVDSGNTMTINGSGFKKFQDLNPDDSEGKGIINFYKGTGNSDNAGLVVNPDDSNGKGTLVKPFPADTKGGPYKVEFKYEKDKLTIVDNYVDLFSVVGRLEISDDITMSPNQGSKGSLVTLEATELPTNMSVFFKVNESDLYELKNMAKKGVYVPRQGAGKNKYIFEVPKTIDPGSYEVILTNEVKETDDPNKAVNSNSGQVFKDNLFIVISDANKPSIGQIYDESGQLKPSGPSTGANRTIKGNYLASISSNIFRTDVAPKLKPELGTADTLVVTYGENTDEKPLTGKDSIGEYTPIKKNGNSVEVTFLEKKITGIIGNNIEFRKGSVANNSNGDSIEVKIPSFTGEDTNLAQDVIFEMTTVIKYQYKDNGIYKYGQEILKEKVVKEKGFTFEQLSYKPEITTITPNQIPVKGRPSGGFQTTVDMKIAIIGKNFSVYKYSVDGVDRYKYPEINIGSEIKLNKNDGSDFDIKILDKNGKEVDGSKNNDLGEKIIVMIPAGSVVSNIGANEAWVVNPNRNEDPTSMGTISESEKVYFVEAVPSKTPTISKITPETVTTDGEKGVIIKGQNFYPGVKVYIDGEEVKGAKINPTGTGTDSEIIFDAPPRSEGYYQILVQNEEGGAEIHYPFTYTKPYTDPKITDFNPKKGTATTLVTIIGKGFVLPNPLVTDLQGIGISKLIGTRVFLGDTEVNVYNKSGNNIVLKDYTTPTDNLLVQKDDNDNLALSDYYNSIILQSGTGKYYTVYFDTNSGDIKLTDGDKEVYALGKLGGKASMAFEVDENNIKIDGKTLKIRTPYHSENGVITGNKIKVINGNELIFEVPAMLRDAYYDLKIVNPDTKSDVKKDKAGFYYSFKPEYNPKIGRIDPKEGSTEGEYFIDIHGEGFLGNGGDDKTAVIIGNIVVDPKDVTVSPDGNTMKVKVPKYPGNLAEETEMDRKTVAVVVVNPDGGSASEEKGFTYIIPISHPKITKLFLSEGAAAGGENVTIEGSEFRFYEPYKDENNNVEWDEGESFTDINSNVKWDDLRHWVSPEKKVSYNKLLKEENGYEKFVLPLLPKVYFGSKQAKIIDFSATSIEVETPKGQNGSVDVYLVNNDYGTSNKLKYSYKASSPKIDTIVPNVGRKQGNDKVEILGSGFHNNDILLIKAEKETETKKMPLVQFGNIGDIKISNKSIAIDAPKNSGKIRDKKSTVEVGNLKVVYDISGDKKDLEFTMTEGTGSDKKEYTFTFKDYKNNEIFFPTSLLKDKDGKSYDKENIVSEYIRVRLDVLEGANSTTRLRIDRGFSPSATIINSGHIALETPSYYTVGKVKITIINPDGSTAEGDFEYKNPDSNPKITNVLRDTQEGKMDDGKKIVRVNVSGGNTIDIIGADFRKPVKIKIGDIPEITTGIEYDPNESITQKMTFKMPKVDDKYAGTRHRIVVENEDGGTTGSDQSAPPIYIEFIKGETTGLTITGVTPSAGPTKGGTRVTISGKDFRKSMEGFEGETLKVYFGDGKDKALVPSTNIESVTIDKIVLKTPPHAAGKVTITVENPDGSIAELKDAYTYISNPKITSIVDPQNGDVKKESLSIEGGEIIKIKGSDFLDGARVVFNPVLKKVAGNPDAQGEIIFIESGDKVEEYILESGTEGTDIKFIDSSNIEVKTPTGKLGTGGVIVINPDDASTPPYDIKYTIPEILSPQDVRAIIVKQGDTVNNVKVMRDEYIRINWNTVVDKATEIDGKTVQYEVYAINGSSREFLGTTGTTGFVFRDMEKNTTYKFLIRAVGKYGSSKPIDESISNEVRTGEHVGPKDEGGKLSEKTKIEKSGDTANVVIGDDAFTQGGEYVVDTTRGILAGSKDVVLSISASTVMKNKDRKIKIVGKDYSLDFHLYVFANAKIKSSTDKPEVGVRFKVASVNPNFDLNAASGDTIIGAKYLLEGKVFAGSSQDNIDNLNGKMNFSLDYDENMVASRRLKTVKLVKYDSYQRIFKNVNGKSEYGTSTGDVTELGTYTITGSRR